MRQAQKKMALEAAREVSGVRSVTEALAVDGLEGAADPARAAAEAALRASPNLEGAEIAVERRDGRLLLRGRVGSGAERELAGLLARDAAGQPVENALEVRR